ncbi:MAG: hypothetical protein SFZ03_03195 [Candidatus Melainabacteria bacterium]|nr:hypothetical protein [Candidatus Melainabacteria bacterium]
MTLVYQPPQSIWRVPAPVAHMAPPTNPPERVLNDSLLAAKTLHQGIQGKNLADYPLGVTDGMFRRVGSVGLAVLAALGSNSRIAGVNELVGVSTWLFSMWVVPRVLNGLFMAKTGFNMLSEYVSTQGSRKRLTESQQYMPISLIDPESIDQFAERMRIPQADRKRLVRQKIQSLTAQFNSLWMLVAGFATPLLAGGLGHLAENTLRLHDRIHDGLTSRKAGQLGQAASQLAQEKDLLGQRLKASGFMKHYEGLVNQLVGESPESALARWFPRWMNDGFMPKLTETVRDQHWQKQLAQSVHAHESGEVARLYAQGLLKLDNKAVDSLLQYLADDKGAQAGLNNIRQGMQTLEKAEDHLRKAISRSVSNLKAHLGPVGNPSLPAAIDSLHAWVDGEGANVKPLKAERLFERSVDEFESRLGALRHQSGLSKGAQALVEDLVEVAKDLRGLEEKREFVWLRMKNAENTLLHHQNVLARLKDPAFRQLSAEAQSHELQRLISLPGLSHLQNRLNEKLFEPAHQLVGGYFSEAKAQALLDDAGKLISEKRWPTAFNLFGASPEQAMLNIGKDFFNRGRWRTGVMVAGGLLSGATLLYTLLFVGNPNRKTDSPAASGALTPGATNLNAASTQPELVLPPAPPNYQYYINPDPLGWRSDAIAMPVNGPWSLPVQSFRPGVAGVPPYGGPR